MSEPPRPLVLAVDDAEEVRELIVAALEDGGYGVVVASGADEAFAILDEKISELGGLVTDIDLGSGEPTGWDIARKARELSEGIPVVYVTGDSAGSWSSQGVPHSVLISKPFAIADLVVALAELRKIG